MQLHSPYNKEETITADYDEIAENITTEPWLHVEEYPTATLEIKDFERNTHNTYRGYGRLMLLGQSHPIEFFFILNEKPDGVMVADAVFSISRLKYGIGKGEWESTSTVADIVTVNAHFVTNPLEAKQEKLLSK